MVIVPLRGVHVVKAKGREYHYAWRGGPRLHGEPGSPAYVKAFADAHEARKQPTTGTFREIITAYKASPAYTSLGEHTTRAYAKPLDTILSKWGDARRAVIEDPRIRLHFIKWHESMAKTPRAADMAIGVLKRVTKWAKNRGLLLADNAEGIERLHSADKADNIWTAGDFKAFGAHASKEVVWAVELAAHTGLRQSDLIRLAWNHEEDGAFVFYTSKRGKEVTIPITAACRALLGRIEKRGPLILTTQRGKRPWTADGLRASFGQARTDAGVTRTFHDLRRTAATNLLRAGLEKSQVAMIMGWSEDDVEAMKRKYVSRSAVVKAALAQLEKGG